jgi:hypothetical protein
VSTLAEIEEAVAALPPGEFRELWRRLQERAAQEWDRQIEEDATNGALNRAYSRLMEEEGLQPVKPLDEVLDDPRLS